MRCGGANGRDGMAKKKDSFALEVSAKVSGNGEDLTGASFWVAGEPAEVSAMFDEVAYQVKRMAEKFNVKYLEENVEAGEGEKFVQIVKAKKTDEEFVGA